jgi:hypothetical protein
MSVPVFAQAVFTVKGKALDGRTHHALSGVKVYVKNTNIVRNTGADGSFTLSGNFSDDDIIVLEKEGYEPQFFPLADKKSPMNLGEILLYEDESGEIDRAVISLTEDDLSDDEAGGADNVAGILQSSKDAFQRAVAFNFGQVWFKARGYDSRYGQVYFNGMPMNKISNGRPQWSDWGGLNDVLRNQVFTNGLAPSENNFGSVLGSTDFITRASQYRSGGKISYALTNSNYNGRIMASYHTGLMNNGWAISLLGSRRYAQEAYMEGTSYNAWSGFMAVEKKLNKHHSLNFTAFYTPNRRGKNSPNTQEVFDLGGTRYNAYWGWQGDRKRNARMKEIKEPTFMLTHYWDVNERSSLQTNLLYQTGTISNSRLGYTGANPDPTYYQHLPSYYLRPGRENYAQAYDLTQSFLQDAPESQLQWDNLYEANSIAGPDAVYYLYDDVNEDELMAVNTLFQTRLNDHLRLNASALYKNINSQNYARMKDLLGAEYFTDLDRYSQGDEAQSDLNHPDRKIKDGEEFSYNYNITAGIADVFAQAVFNYEKTDFYLSGNVGNTTYQREGLYKNGNHPDTSFGKGEQQDFLTYGIKTGFTYKITGRHLINLNAGYITQAPSLRNTYSNARVNQDIVPGITTEKIMSVDANYILRTPVVKARLSGYYTSFKDLNEVSFFFAQGLNLAGFDLPDDVTGDSYFLNTALTGIAKKHFGGELGAEIQVLPTLSFSAVASVGQFTYDNNPELYIAADEFSTTHLGTAYLKNYKTSGTPQRGYSLGFNYRDPKYWWVSANANYLTNNYISISPILRTDNFYTDSFGNPIPFQNVSQEQVDTLLAQEKFDDIFLINLVGGKSWKIHNKFLGFFISVNNLLGEQYKTGGFEQARKANFEELAEDRSYEHPLFGNKYWYGRGTSYYINLYVRF